MSSDLKPCPFCGDQPTFSGVEHRDDNRYVAMELDCCTVLTETLPWHTFKSMDDESIKRSLRAELVKSWNKRYETEEAAPVASLIPTEQQTLPILEEDDEAVFPNDTNLAIIHKDRYWKLRGCEDICAALDATPTPAVIARPAEQDQAQQSGNMPRFAAPAGQLFATVSMLRRFASFMLTHKPEFFKDHACARCVPEGGDMVYAGFICAWHEAQDVVGGILPQAAHLTDDEIMDMAEQFLDCGEVVFDEVAFARHLLCTAPAEQTSSAACGGDTKQKVSALASLPVAAEMRPDLASLQRFDLIEHQHGRGHDVYWEKSMDEDPVGEWIRFTDVERLLAPTPAPGETK